MSAQLLELKKDLKAEIAASLNREGELSDAALYQTIDEKLLSRDDLSLKNKLYLRNAVFNSFRRLDVLQELLDNPAITEIMINSDKEIFVEAGGRMQRWDKQFESGDQLEEIINMIVSRINRVVNTSSPIVDARLEDGSRVHVVLPPIALKGPTMTIRKFPEPITMDKLIRFGSLSEEAAVFLQGLVRAGYNIFISGGTNSGKTTFLNALSQYIPSDERVITIEDSAELQIRNVPNLVSMETRNENAEGEGRISMADLIKASLRMSPNRIVVGGESAGGGLAAAVCIRARDEGKIPVSCQIPLYPMLDCNDTESSRHSHSHGWGTRRNHWGWHKYLGDLYGTDHVPSYASPSRETDYSGLPPCYTFVEDGEPFRDETLTYVQNLKDAGVEAHVDVFHGNIHGFDTMRWTRNAKEARKKLILAVEKFLK